MGTTYNGWTTLDDYPGQAGVFTSPGPGFKQVYTRNRPVAVILEAMARRWHREVEPIAYSHSDNWFKPRERKNRNKSGVPDLIGIHCYRPPNTTVGTGERSNHRAGMAIDINGHLHPYEATVKNYDDGFDQLQRDKVREIARWVRTNSGRSIGRSGLDFARGKRDGMHLEIGPGVAMWEIEQAAKKLEDYVGRSSTANVWWKGAKGLDVRGVQNQLNRAGFNVGEADGIAGSKTDDGVRELQRVAGLEEDGRVGNDTRKALALAEVGEGLEPIQEEAELSAAADDIVKRVNQHVDRRIDEMKDEIVEEVVEKVFRRASQGLSFDYWSRMGLVLDPDHSQYPADPGSPGDMLIQIYEEITGKPAVPYDGSQKREKE